MIGVIRTRADEASSPKKSKKQKHAGGRTAQLELLAVAKDSQLRRAALLNLPSADLLDAVVDVKSGFITVLSTFTHCVHD